MPLLLATIEIGRGDMIVYPFALPFPWFNPPRDIPAATSANDKVEAGVS